MKAKDRVIGAIDRVTEVLNILSRIDYDNPLQTQNNMKAAAIKLNTAVFLLDSFSTFEGSE